MGTKNAKRYSLKRGGVKMHSATLAILDGIVAERLAKEGTDGKDR